MLNNKNRRTHPWLCAVFYRAYRELCVSRRMPLSEAPTQPHGLNTPIHKNRGTWSTLIIPEFINSYAWMQQGRGDFFNLWRVMVCLEVRLMSAVERGQEWRRSVDTYWKLEPYIRVHSSLLKQCSPHVSTPPAHTWTPPPHTCSFSLLSVSPWASPPPSPHTLTPSTSPALSPFLPFSFSSFLTSTYSPQAWEHNPLNERIWLSKMNHKPKTSKLSHICQPPTLYNTTPYIHPPSCS